jgi:aryl-alcohol dehydrogenase-like predicted oxidoreductase
VTFSSGALEDDALLDGLTELKGAGVAIGLSLSGPDQAAVLQDALVITRDGERLFETVQATWNVLEQSAGAALAAAHGAGMGVIVKEALANGRLTDRGDANSPALSDAAKAHGVGVDAVALAAVLANDWADVVLSGAATIAHLRSNIASAGVQLSTDELSRIRDLVEEPAEYWKLRDELEWS